MKYILKWNQELESGYVLNEVYPKGYVFEDVSQKPILHIQYQDVNYDEAVDVYTLTINESTRVMTDEEKSFVKAVAVKFTDTRYGGTKTVQDKKSELLTAMTAGFTHNVEGLAGFTPSHEMDSWDTQQAEAEAYIADNTSVTPLIDAILETRGTKYTKVQFCYKVVEKAIYYKANYGKLLGTYNKELDAVEAIVTEEDYLAYVGAI